MTTSRDLHRDHQNVPAAPTTAALLLPGQAAAPPGPCDMSGMYLMHHAFRRDLRDFTAAAGHTPPEDGTTWRAINERWGHFSHHLHGHHSVEDRVLWPLLLDRVDAAGDTAGREVLAAMEAEHEQIDPLLQECSDLLESMLAAPDAAVRTRLVTALTGAAEVLDAHLSHEERQAVVLVQRHVGGAEWEELERKEFRGKPSLGELRFQLPWMVHEVPDEVVTAMVRAAGPVFAFVLRISRRRFLQQQAAAFRHVQ
ncbi:hemerythrin domain-containing protein [Nocardioides sp. Root190]|uniref:hemerythrin domain-containing protein n=1 Tax=Nocardioides sp. Root190 TaxID=1736488 RepID=UPI000AF1F610|nr:hemerythrin domain-containing protein [Nocardioides sp. Root190]